MIGPLINAIVTVLSWIIGGIADIAGFLGGAAGYVSQIPVVGAALSNLCVSAQSACNTLGYDVAHFSTRVSDALWAIDDWLDKLKDLWDQVFGWILDKLDDAYKWAQNAIDQVADLATDVGNLIYEVFTSIPGKISSVWDKINTIIAELFTSIPGKLSSLWDKINTIIAELFTSIPDKLSSLWDRINTIIAELFTSIPGKLSSIWDRIAALPELIKGMVMQPIAPFINLISFFFEDINDFFSDPAEYFLKKVERLGASFAERMWNVVETILEKIW
jgi:phage-related protein